MSDSVKILITALFISFPFFQAIALEAGSEIKAFQLKDQHDKEQTVGPDVKLLIFVKEDDANKLIAKALDKVEKGYLEKKKVVYVADISKMPGFVASWFALPKMRKYPYLVLLDRKPDVTKSLPSKKNEVTFVYLNNLKVEKVEYFSNPKKIRVALDSMN